METTMESLGARMAAETKETTKLLKSAGKWLGNAKKMPTRVIKELQQKGTDISAKADGFAQETQGLDGAPAVCVEKFVAGMRAIAGAVLMSATGLATGDITMLWLAEVAQHEGTAVMTAAWLTTQNWDQATGA